MFVEGIGGMKAQEWRQETAIKRKVSTGDERWRTWQQDIHPTNRKLPSFTELRQLLRPAGLLPFIHRIGNVTCAGVMDMSGNAHMNGRVAGESTGRRAIVGWAVLTTEERENLVAAEMDGQSLHVTWSDGVRACVWQGADDQCRQMAEE